MSVRLYDTATRQVRDFVPLEAGKVGIYLCGLTVQSEPRVGHARSGVIFDVLRRWGRGGAGDARGARRRPDDEHWAASSSAPWERLSTAVDKLVFSLLKWRARARAEKDFAAADAIRDQLNEAGIEIEDPSGSHLGAVTSDAKPRSPKSADGCGRHGTASAGAALSQSF